MAIPSVFKRFAQGLFAWYEGFRFLSQHQLWSFVALPAFVSLLVSAALWSGVFFGGDYLADLGTERLTEEFAWLDHSIIQAIFAVTATIFFALLALILTLVLFRFVLSIVVLPFLGPLVEEIEFILLGRKLETTFKQDLRNGIYGALTGMKHSIVGLLLLIISLILGPLNFLVNVPAQSYFLGRGPFDMLFEKAAPDRAGRNQLRKQYRPEILGSGLAFFVLLLIPVLGALLAPIAIVSGVARLYYTRQKQLEDV